MERTAFFPIRARMTTIESLALEAGHDPAAFAALYDRYVQRVYAYLRYRLDDPQEAEELCALIFERLLTRLARFDPARGPFEPWLFAVARHALSDHIRRERLRSFFPLDLLSERAGSGPSPEEQAERDEQVRALRQALGTLNDAERDLLGLKFAAGLPNHEIAALSGLSENVVGVRVFRAVRKLRAAMGSTEQEAEFSGVHG